jgi:hypothetical protein
MEGTTPLVLIVARASTTDDATLLSLFHKTADHFFSFFLSNTIKSTKRFAVPPRSTGRVVHGQHDTTKPGRRHICERARLLRPPPVLSIVVVLAERDNPTLRVLFKAPMTSPSSSARGPSSSSSTGTLR